MARPVALRMRQVRRRQRYNDGSQRQHCEMNDRAVDAVAREQADMLTASSTLRLQRCRHALHPIEEIGEVTVRHCALSRSATEAGVRTGRSNARASPRCLAGHAQMAGISSIIDAMCLARKGPARQEPLHIYVYAYMCTRSRHMRR